MGEQVRAVASAIVVVVLVAGCGSGSSGDAEPSGSSKPSGTPSGSASPSSTPSATPSSEASGLSSPVTYTDDQLAKALPRASDLRGFKITFQCRTVGRRCSSDGTPGVVIRGIARPVQLGAPQVVLVGIYRTASRRAARQMVDQARRSSLPNTGRFDLPAARSRNGLQLAEKGTGTLKGATSGPWVGLLHRGSVRYSKGGETTPTRRFASVFLVRNRYFVVVSVGRWPGSPGPAAYDGMQTLLAQVLTSLDGKA